MSTTRARKGRDSRGRSAPASLRALASALAFGLAFFGGGLHGAGAQSESTDSATVRDSLAAYEKQIQTQEGHLQELRSQIKDLRRRDQKLKKEEVGTLEQLEILDKEVALTADLLRQLGTKRQRLEAQLEGIRAEHSRAEEILAERKGRLARTLRAMHMRGTTNTAEVLLRTSNLRDALTHYKYLEMLARNNERLYLEIRQQEVYLKRTSAQLTEKLAAVSATATETQEEKKRLDDGRKARQSTLQRVRRQRGEHQKSIRDLAASEQQLQGLIATLERRREELRASGQTVEFPDLGFRDLRGRMPWPVAGRVTTRFGRHLNPRHQTETFNSGIDIVAAEGEPVRSVARGRVEYVQWLKGYGRTIIINHGSGFYTVYAHLSEALVAEKQEVEPGQTIARVGDTGSLEGPKLHFEIRDKATALDPMMWLGS